MGCASSKDSVQAITVENGVVKPASGKARKIKVHGTDSSDVNDNNAVRVGSAKARSAKSRDSGIDEMSTDGMITEGSDPHLISEIENEGRPVTPDLSLVGHQLSGNSIARERMKSKVILEELESQGLISATKVQKGGASFEVSVSAPLTLEPLPPIRPPPRLEKLNHDKPTLTKEELEKKLEEAEMRRQKSLSKPKKRSRLASQLARDREFANNIEESSGDDAPNFDESQVVNPFKSSYEIPLN